MQSTAIRAGKATKAILFILVMMIMCSVISSCNTEKADTSEAVSSDVSSDVSSEDPNAIKSQSVIESFPMTFTKVSERLYKMECAAPDGNKLRLTFDKKDWGTYNIGTWTVIDESGNAVNLAGGGTDWEYVYRAGMDSTNMVWSGGNHGNELLIDIKFLDGESNKELELKDGEPVNLNSLKIIENTKLHWGDTSNTYCNVTRSYTVVGSQIRLDVSYDYTQDCYQWLSYTCMFPVDKQYGLYCSFISRKNKLLQTVETLKVGAADYSGDFLGKKAADRCIIWGYVKPEYKFEVKVGTVADSCDNFKNSNKTFYWDMNTTHNKLYFSKYEMNTPSLVKSGTKLNTSSMWTFYIEN
jgi:hypothetical protein